MVRRLYHLDSRPIFRSLCHEIRAYRQSDKAHQAHLDIDINASGNTDPRSIYYDGTTFYVTDSTDDKVYAYNTPPSNDATVSSITANGTAFSHKEEESGFSTYNQIGFANTVTQATVAVATTDSNAAAVITPADSDTNTDGHQVSLSAGGNTVTIVVTAEDGATTTTHTVQINRGVTDASGWKVTDDFDTLIAAHNRSLGEIWSDSTTMWVVDSVEKKIYAYNKSTKARDPGKDFNTLDAAQNDRPFGLWSDGTTAWVSDFQSKLIYKYNLSTKAHDPNESFNNLDAAENDNPSGIWSDGTTMWVADSVDGKIYAYGYVTRPGTATRISTP